MVFDFDGVISNSNEMKEKALFDTLIAFGGEMARVDLSLRENKGKSRVVHFDFVFSDLNADFNSFNSFNSIYSKYIIKNYLTCEYFRNFRKLKKILNCKWLIISSTTHKDLVGVVNAMKISEYFELGCFGGPKNKDVLFDEFKLEGDGLVIGDGLTDFRLSKNKGADFCFLSSWSNLTEDEVKTVTAEYYFNSLESVVDFHGIN